MVPPPPPPHNYQHVDRRVSYSSLFPSDTYAVQMVLITTLAHYIPIHCFSSFKWSVCVAHWTGHIGFHCTVCNKEWFWQIIQRNATCRLPAYDNLIWFNEGHILPFFFFWHSMFVHTSPSPTPLHAPTCLEYYKYDTVSPISIVLRFVYRHTSTGPPGGHNCNILCAFNLVIRPLCFVVSITLIQSLYFLLYKLIILWSEFLWFYSVLHHHECDRCSHSMSVISDPCIV